MILHKPEIPQQHREREKTEKNVRKRLLPILVLKPDFFFKGKLQISLNANFDTLRLPVSFFLEQQAFKK